MASYLTLDAAIDDRQIKLQLLRSEVNRVEIPTYAKLLVLRSNIPDKSVSMWERAGELYTLSSDTSASSSVCRASDQCAGEIP